MRTARPSSPNNDLEYTRPPSEESQLEDDIKMFPNWKDGDPNTFARVKYERFPAVQQASQNLQTAMGIEPGTKTIGETSMLLWQMPEPPTQTTAEMFESLKAKINAVGSKKTGSVNDEAEEATGEGWPEGVNHMLLPPAHPNCYPGGPIMRPASPPPSWISNAQSEGLHHVPPYWQHTLSFHIAKWLEQPSTKSSQIFLERLSLRSFSSDRKSYIDCATAEWDAYGKVKLIRLSLPASLAVQKKKNQPQSQSKPLLDWLIFQISYRDKRDLENYQAQLDFNDSSSDDSDFIPVPFGSVPHWVLAFPLQAVTEVGSQCIHLPSSKLPWRPTKAQMRRKEQPPEERIVHVTKLVLGGKGMAPIFHGRGVRPDILKRFVEACVKGLAVVEVRSLERGIGEMLK